MTVALLYFLVLASAQAKFYVWLLSVSGLLVFATIVARGGLQNALLAMASASVVLCGLEGVGLFVEPSIVYDSSEGLVAPRPVVGWGPAHAGTFTDRKIVDGNLSFDARYTIGPDLYRVVATGTDGPAVSFLGDSVIFGRGLNDPETLPQQFADLEGRKLPVFNIAVPGFSPAQILATMQSGMSDALLRKSELFVAFLAPWHAERTACRVSWTKSAPRYRIVDGLAHRDGECAAPWYSIFERSHFYKAFIMPQLGANSDADFAQLVAITKEMIRLARETYRVPIIVYYLEAPEQFQGTRWSDDRIVSEIEAAGAHVLLYNIPNEGEAPYAIALDHHPTGLANAIHADRLAATIRSVFPALAVSDALARRQANARRP